MINNRVYEDSLYYTDNIKECEYMSLPQGEVNKMFAFSNPRRDEGIIDILCYASKYAKNPWVLLCVSKRFWKSNLLLNSLLSFDGTKDIDIKFIGEDNKPYGMVVREEEQKDINYYQFITEVFQPFMENKWVCTWAGGFWNQLGEGFNIRDRSDYGIDELLDTKIRRFEYKSSDVLTYSRILRFRVGHYERLTRIKVSKDYLHKKIVNYFEGQLQDYPRPCERWMLLEMTGRILGIVPRVIFKRNLITIADGEKTEVYMKFMDNMVNTKEIKSLEDDIRKEMKRL